jgi:DNA polymerase (family 10)
MGEKLRRVSYNGVQVDIYYASLENWGITLLVRTGSTEHNKKLIAIAKRQGFYFSVARGIENREGKVIASQTEEELFSALGLRYIPPEEREKWLNYLK